MVFKITKYFQENPLAHSLLNRMAVHEAKCDKSGGHPVTELDEVHLLEAIDWLVRAQDAMPYGGLSRGYSFGWNPYFLEQDHPLFQRIAAVRAHFRFFRHPIQSPFRYR